MVLWGGSVVALRLLRGCALATRELLALVAGFEVAGSAEGADEVSISFTHTILVLGLEHKRSITTTQQFGSKRSTKFGSITVFEYDGQCVSYVPFEAIHDVIMGLSSRALNSLTGTLLFPTARQANISFVRDRIRLIPFSILGEHHHVHPLSHGNMALTLFGRQAFDLRDAPVPQGWHIVPLCESRELNVLVDSTKNDGLATVVLAMISIGTL